MRRRRALRRFWRQHLALCFQIAFGRPWPRSWRAFRDGLLVAWEQLHVTPRMWLDTQRRRHEIRRRAVERLVAGLLGEPPEAT